jgi:hypothetical protein
MSTTALIESPTRSAVRDRPSLGDMLAEIVPLVDVAAVDGPPIVLLALPLTLGTLMLAGPFALLVTGAIVVVVALVAAAAAVALAGAIVATPYLLGRRLRAHRRRVARIGAPAGKLVTA